MFVETETQAYEEAGKIASLMKFGTWIPKVWANGNTYCYCIVNGKGFLEIHPVMVQGEVKYRAYLSDTHSGIGSPSYYYVKGMFHDPNLAVKAQMLKLRDFVKTNVRILRLLEINIECNLNRDNLV